MRADGEGDRLLAHFVVQLDPVNPQIASRLVQAMILWLRFDERRQRLQNEQLQRVMGAEGCSQNTYEVVSRALG